MGFFCLFICLGSFVWKGIMPVQKNVEHFLETSCQSMSLMHIWDIGSTIISHSGSYHLSRCQTISRHICLSQGGENMSMHLEMERKAVLLAHPDHITTSGASGHIQGRLAPSTQYNAQKGHLVHFQGSFNCNIMLPKYHCCMLFIGSLVAFLQSQKMHETKMSLRGSGNCRGGPKPLRVFALLWGGAAVPLCRLPGRGKAGGEPCKHVLFSLFLPSKEMGCLRLEAGHQLGKVWWENGPGKTCTWEKKRNPWNSHS